MRYGFCSNCLFRFLKALRKHTRFYLGLGYEKDGDHHSESFDSSSNPSRTKRSNYFLKISSCNFSTGYGRENIGFTSYFSSESTGSVLQVLSVISSNSSNHCNNSINSLYCVSDICGN